jgi:DNA polymerase-3 subunit epsilon
LDGDHRVLHRVSLGEEVSCLTDDVEHAAIGVVIDVETTGLNPKVDKVIELAVRRFLFDEEGQILEIERGQCWREDPGHSLDPGIVRLTGITDADLVGRCIDSKAIEDVLLSAHVVIAHNAAFDRKFVERRLPGATGLAWCCSCNEVNWADAGYHGRGLGWLAAQAGWLFDGHRAGNDVDAVIALLQMRMTDGRTALRELLDTAGTTSTVLKARGASFEVKDALRLRGYRWDPKETVWKREVTASALMDEDFWLSLNVYAPQFRPRDFGPERIEISWFERHA